jgi:hypothetical protein
MPSPAASHRGYGSIGAHRAQTGATMLLLFDHLLGAAMPVRHFPPSQHVAAVVLAGMVALIFLILDHGVWL